MRLSTVRRAFVCSAAKSARKNGIFLSAHILTTINLKNLEAGRLLMMNHVCAQCSKQLNDNDKATRLIDEYIFFLLL